MNDTIRVVIDFASPAAYLAIEPTRALESQLGRAFEWLPLTVPALQKHTPTTADDDRGARHRHMRAEYLARDLCRYAAARGLALGDLYRDPDTSSATLGLLWLRRRAPAVAGAYVTRVFDRIWRDNAAADPAFIAEVLGGDARGFDAYVEDEGPREVAAVRAELEVLAVWNVPAILLHGELFLGRQHLPMVEWLATGRTGPPPI